MNRIFIAILFAYAVRCNLAAAAPDLTLSATVDQAVVDFGAPISVVATLLNTGQKTVLLVARDANFVVEITDSAQKTSVIESPRYTREALPFAENQVPLRSRATYSTPLPIPLNDLSATLGEGWLAEPGTYSLRIVYDSTRSTLPNSRWVWTGSLRSNNVRVKVNPATRAQVNKMLEALRACITQDDYECDSIRLANFFRVVRHDAAPELIVALLAKSPHETWWLAAIAAQGRASDAVRIREIASKLLDKNLEPIFIRTAVTLEHAASVNR